MEYCPSNGWTQSRCTAAAAVGPCRIESINQKSNVSLSNSQPGPSNCTELARQKYCPKGSPPYGSDERRHRLSDGFASGRGQQRPRPQGMLRKVPPHIRCNYRTAATSSDGQTHRMVSLFSDAICHGMLPVRRFVPNLLKHQWRPSTQPCQIRHASERCSTAPTVLHGTAEGARAAACESPPDSTRRAAAHSTPLPHGHNVAAWAHGIGWCTGHSAC